MLKVLSLYNDTFYYESDCIGLDSSVNTYFSHDESNTRPVCVQYVDLGDMEKLLVS